MSLSRLAPPRFPPVPRINARISLTPSGSTYSVKIAGDKLPSWEFVRYPTNVWAGIAPYGDSRTIGTRTQTNLTKKVIVDYFASSATLKLAIEQGDLDVAFHGFSPAEIAQLRTEMAAGVQVLEDAVLARVEALEDVRRARELRLRVVGLDRVDERQRDLAHRRLVLRPVAPTLTAARHAHPLAAVDRGGLHAVLIAAGRRWRSLRSMNQSRKRWLLAESLSDAARSVAACEIARRPGTSGPTSREMPPDDPHAAVALARLRTVERRWAAAP